MATMVLTKQAQVKARSCAECGKVVVDQDWRREYEYCSLACATAALPKRSAEVEAAQRDYDNVRRILDVPPESSRLWGVYHVCMRAMGRRNAAEVEIAMYRDGPRQRP
jgi:endogenous inhibitor of DNA gyrase (YacG/DUF329 family)